MSEINVWDLWTVHGHLGLPNKIPFLSGHTYIKSILGKKKSWAEQLQLEKWQLQVPLPLDQETRIGPLQNIKYTFQKLIKRSMHSF